MTIEELYSIYKSHPFITTDTRNILTDSLFFALKGDNFNGNKFAEDALAKGCSYAVVDEKEYVTNENILLVDNVLKTLQELAKYHRSTFKIPVIGITGTNGKTTSKELINAVLSTQYNTFATKGNLNNHIGVPLSLLSVTPKHEIAIIEMGANHVGEIEFLCNISNPDFGIITNVGKAHLEGFGSFENVIKTKTELYQSIVKHKGKLFVNADNPILTDKASGIDNIYYGKDENNFVSGNLLENEETLTFTYNKNTIKTNLVGNYNFENALAAIAIGKYFGIDDNNIKSALESYTPTNNRSQLIKKGSNSIIMDAYNANPVSMKAALLSLAKNLNSKKLAILGDMRELGKYSNDEHKQIIDLLSELNINAYLVGPEFSKVEQSSFKTFENADQLSQFIENGKIEDTLLLIKGSRGIKLETVLESIQ